MDSAVSNSDDKSDRSLKSTLTPIVNKLSDMRVINADLEYMITGQYLRLFSFRSFVDLRFYTVRFREYPSKNPLGELISSAVLWKLWSAKSALMERENTILCTVIKSRKTEVDFRSSSDSRVMV